MFLRLNYGWSARAERASKQGQCDPHHLWFTHVVIARVFFPIHMEMYWVLIERSQLGFGIYLQLLQVSVLLQWKTNPKPHRRPHDINFTPNRAKNVLRPRPNTPNLTIIASQKPEEEQPTRNATEMSFMLASESNHKKPIRSELTSDIVKPSTYMAAT